MITMNDKGYKMAIKKSIKRRHKNWHYRIITFLASSSNITYIRSIPVRAFRGRYKVVQDFKNIIEDLGVEYSEVISAYALNRIMHIRKTLPIVPEFIYIEESADSLAEYAKFRRALIKRFRMVSYRIK